MANRSRPSAPKGYEGGDKGYFDVKLPSVPVKGPGSVSSKSGVKAGKLSEVATSSKYEDGTGRGYC